MPFSPGPGVGGHCIPVDPSYLAHVANEVGVPATFIKRANEVILAMEAPSRHHAHQSLAGYCAWRTCSKDMPIGNRRSHKFDCQ